MREGEGGGAGGGLAHCKRSLSLTGGLKMLLGENESDGREGEGVR